MKISVIVPVYNVEKYLIECLDSIVKQTFNDFEIICVEDCSTDDSSKILDDYEKKYKNIKVIYNKENRGLSYSRNIGLEHANGEYVLFVDSDDYLEKNALLTLFEEAQRKNCEILYYNKKILYEDCFDKKEREYKEQLYYDGVYTGKELFVEFANKGIYKSINAYTQFFTRKFLIENNLRFYNSVVHEDYIFYFQCALKAKRVANIDKQLYIYRKRASSITTNVKEINKMSIFFVWNQILKEWRNGDFTEQEDEAIRYFAEMVYRNCERYVRITNYHNDTIFGSAIDRHLYRILMNNKFVKLTDEQLEEIRVAKSVWIYGAGEVGNEVACVLEKNDISINGYVVSDKTKCKEKIFGWDVFQLDQLHFNEDDLVIIATIRYQKEMRMNLEKQGTQRIMYATEIKEESNETKSNSI